MANSAELVYEIVVEGKVVSKTTCTEKEPWDLKRKHRIKVTRIWKDSTGSASESSYITRPIILERI